MDPTKEVAEEEVVDELGSWFDEDDNAEDLAALDDYDDDDESSPSESEEETKPADKDHDSDADKASDDGTSAKAPAQEDPYAWVSELDPDLKHKVEALVHRDRSNTGRVAALTRRLDQMQTQQMAASPRKAADRPAANVGTPVEGVADDDLQEFEKEFPNVARNMRKIIEQRVAKEREEILGEVRPFQQQLQQQRLMAEKEQLRRNAEIIFNTQETGVGLDEVLQSPRWREWLAEQPRGYQQFATRANTVEDASKVLNDFAKWSVEIFEQEHPQSPTAPATNPAANKADETAAKRRAALQGSSPKSRSAELADRGNSSTYEDYFNEAVERG